MSWVMVVGSTYNLHAHVVAFILEMSGYDVAFATSVCNASGHDARCLRGAERLLGFLIFTHRHDMVRRSRLL